MIVFTICSRNFLGYSEALWTSVKQHHPDAKFNLFLVDEWGPSDRLAFPYPIITIDELGIPEIESMKAAYNISELNTSIKPFAFLFLFDRHPGEAIAYFDPDIMIFSRLRELEDAFAQGVDCVLTPHITQPAEFGDMDDFKFLQYGIYNLGFCALRDTDTTRRIVAWWGRRLQQHCRIDLGSGIFLDQKWADYLPAFIENTCILRHPGYNVAYWNLAQRRLSFADDEWRVNGEPLRFFHFSGNRIEDPEVFTRHSGQFTLQNTPILRTFLETYRSRLIKGGHPYYSSTAYAFSWSGPSGFNEHAPESYRREEAQHRVPHLPLLRSRSIESFRFDRDHNAETIEGRRRVESTSIPGNFPFTQEGFCYVCRDRRTFQVSQMYASGALANGLVVPNWREHLDCLSCGTINRVRGALHVLDQEFDLGPDALVYVTEQMTPLFARLSDRWPAIVGSEYLSPGLAGGTEKDGIRHEDVQALSFTSQAFDLILSFDVLEHVADIRTSFRELLRCLKPGGRLLFTAPFSFDSRDEVVRAVLRDGGELEHILDPEYHGNPVDPAGGSLCYRYFGWSVVSQLEDAGFTEAEVISYWSAELQYYGDPQFVITARRPDAARP